MSKKREKEKDWSGKKGNTIMKLGRKKRARQKRGGWTKNGRRKKGKKIFELFVKRECEHKKRLKRK